MNYLAIAINNFGSFMIRDVNDLRPLIYNKIIWIKDPSPEERRIAKSRMSQYKDPEEFKIVKYK